MSAPSPPASAPLRKLRARRLRDEVLLGAVVIALVVALASMFAVSVVIRQQYLDQSNAVLNKAFSRLTFDPMHSAWESLTDVLKKGR